MIVTRFESTRRIQPEPGWQRASLCDEQQLSVEYFEKPPGHASPVHEHENGQLTIVLKGRMKVWKEGGEPVELGPFDTAWFPPGERHAVQNALAGEVSVGIDVFVPGRDFDFWLKKLGMA